MRALLYRSYANEFGTLCPPPSNISLRFTADVVRDARIAALGPGDPSLLFRRRVADGERDGEEEWLGCCGECFFGAPCVETIVILWAGKNQNVLAKDN